MSTGQKFGQNISNVRKLGPNFGRRYVWVTDRMCLIQQHAQMDVAVKTNQDLFKHVQAYSKDHFKLSNVLNWVLGIQNSAHFQPMDHPMRAQTVPALGSITPRNQ